MGCVLVHCCCRSKKTNYFEDSQTHLLAEYKSINNTNVEIQNINDLKIKASNFIRRRSCLPSDLYENISLIGEGAFGKVMKVRHKGNKEIRAMKVILKSLLVDGMSDIEVYNEIKILKSLDHPNIIKIYEFFIDNTNIYIVTEYCEKGDLYNNIKTMAYLSEKIVCHIMRQILSAVAYLHSKNIFHGDLKLENILIDSTSSKLNEEQNKFFDIKLIDFGCSRIFANNKKFYDLIGTAYYVAPEVLQNNYNEKCDIWSCGVITYILLCGKPPFDGKTETDILNSIIEKTPVNYDSSLFQGVSNLALDLIKNMLNYDNENRPSAAKMLRHRWFLIQRTNTIDFLDKSFTRHVLSNLKNFRTEQKFQQAVITFITHNFAKREEMTKLRNLFRFLDRDSDGRISVTELRLSLLEECGEIESREAEGIMAKIDLDNNGYIEYEEFLSATIEKSTFLSEINLKQAFDLFDLDKGGSISSEEVRNIISGGKVISDDVVKDLFKGINKNLDDEINYDDFKNLMYKILDRE